jgi:hypothetical protein
MPKQESIEKLVSYGHKITCTTAHKRYSNNNLTIKHGIPVHHLSTFGSSEKYIRKAFRDKDDLLIVSHDSHQDKEKILDLIMKSIPNIKVKIIKNMTYEEYKQLISEAKWAITFGEGLDGYFAETIYSGGISFAVYNDDFFTPDFQEVKTIYKSFDDLYKNIIQDLKFYSNEANHRAEWEVQYKILSSHYQYNEYVKNIRNFYEEKYSI